MDGEMTKVPSHAFSCLSFNSFSSASASSLFTKHTTRILFHWITMFDRPSSGIPLTDRQIGRKTEADKDIINLHCSHTAKKTVFFKISTKLVWCNTSNVFCPLVSRHKYSCNTYLWGFKPEILLSFLFSAQIRNEYSPNWVRFIEKGTIFFIKSDW